tara:strand:+ start:1093 stop:1536 length:444 start_codon:yes stop_codon:yes gene_type:complete
MINKNNIFGLFEENSNINVHDIVNAPKDFLESPIAKLGMFTKLIGNHEIFHQKLAKFIKQEKKVIDIEETKEASALSVYNRAWYYINKINLNDKEDYYALLDFKSSPIIDALNKAISYFENKEEYEKCARLLEIKNFKENLEKDLPI